MEAIYRDNYNVSKFFIHYGDQTFVCNTDTNTLDLIYSLPITNELWHTNAVISNRDGSVAQIDYLFGDNRIGVQG
jgi:hypothetical protein